MLDCEESWVPKNCFWTVVLEKTLESPLDWKEIQPVNPWRKSTLNIHWKDWCWSWSSSILATWCKGPTHWKRPWCWEDWRQEEKGKTEDEMVGWHHRLNGHEFEQTLRDSEGQGSLVCCSSLVYKVRHDLATEQQISNDDCTLFKPLVLSCLFPLKLFNNLIIDFKI